MSSQLASKLGLKAQTRAYLGGAPKGVAQDLASGPAGLVSRMNGAFQFMLAFFESAADLERRFDRLRAHLAEGGALWVAWPKGGGRGTDLSLRKIIEIGYRHEMVESKTIALDASWSDIKFTVPRPGKHYRNGYGQLASQA